MQLNGFILPIYRDKLLLLNLLKTLFAQQTLGLKIQGLDNKRKERFKIIKLEK